MVPALFGLNCFAPHPQTVASPARRPGIQRREAFKERREELGVQEDLDSFDIKARAREEAKAKAEEQVRVDFEDGHTQTMFGDTVTVTTVEGIPDSDDEDAIEMERLERELLEEKKRLRAERLVGKGRGGGGRVHKPGKVGRGGVAGSAEGTAEERWSLAAVSKRLAANMPTKPRKGSSKRGGSTLGAETSLEKGKKKGKKRKKGTAAGAGGIAGAGAASALVDKARGSMPRTELSKGKKRRKG